MWRGAAKGWPLCWEVDDRMNDQLKAQWAADVPASDPRFVLGVMTRIEQRRFQRELAVTAGLTACAIALLWLLAPTVEIVWRDGIAPHASNAAILLALMGVTVTVPYLFPIRE
jgi:hypothetical protein